MQERDEEHFVGLVVQKAVIVQDGKVLMVKNSGDAKWDFPGGRLNVGELPEEGVVREVKEEVGLDCVVESVIYTNQYVHEATQKRMFLIVYKTRSVGELRVASNELSDFSWINPTDLLEHETFKDYSDILKLV